MVSQEDEEKRSKKVLSSWSKFSRRWTKVIEEGIVKVGFWWYEEKGSMEVWLHACIHEMGSPEAEKRMQEGILKM